MTTDTHTHTRVQVSEAFPAALSDLLRLAGTTRKIAADAGVAPELIELVKIRASQLNNCAFCVDMHTREARAAGESERRLHLIAAWRETDLFSATERTALELTETLTRLAETRDLPEALYDRALQVFNEQQYAAIVHNIAMINVWNRLSVASHKPLPE
ncbi:MAG TPA: carboxymuconolactone decarboxylase family protein [Sporichthya sp.]|nr:carboxymuconolactone decarboxylase family protein [Sporichthya sp.]